MTSYKKLNKQLVSAGEKLQNAVGTLNVQVNRVEYVDGFFVAELKCEADVFQLAHPVPDLAGVEHVIPDILDAVRKYLTPKKVLLQ